MGRLNNRFDKDKVQQELDVQRQVSQDFSRNVQQAKVEINQKIDALKQQRDSGQISEAEYQRQVDNWQRFSTSLSVVASGLSAPTDSALGIAAASANPVVSYHIGQHFKRNAELNKIDGGNRPEENSKEHRALHALNGIISAAAADNNALLGGLAAGGAEIIAPTLAETLYGKDAKDLNADEKATISSLTSLLGAAVGAASGNAAEAVSGSQMAQGAVDNNYYLTPTALEKNPHQVRNVYNVLREQIKKECASSGRIAECRQSIDRIIEFTKDARFAQNYGDLQQESIRFLSENPQLVSDYLIAQHNKSSKKDKSILNRYIIPGAEIVAGGSGIVISIQGGAASCASTFGFSCMAAAAGVYSSSDHLTTGLNNFGKKASEQNPTITVQGLKQLGLSDEAANNIQFALDMFSVGKAGMSVPTKITRPQYTENAVNNSPATIANEKIAETTNDFFGQQRNYWSKEPIQFSGNIVYQRDDLINPHFVDPKSGMTNLELMKAGRAPIGSDGKPINLHHMLQSQKGPIAEVTQSFHQNNSSVIHINTGSNIPSGINRASFNKWRSEYWINRANDFKR